MTEQKKLNAADQEYLIGEPVVVAIRYDASGHPPVYVWRKGLIVGVKAQAGPMSREWLFEYFVVPWGDRERAIPHKHKITNAERFLSTDMSLDGQIVELGQRGLGCQK